MLPCVTSCRLVARIRKCCPGKSVQRNRVTRTGQSMPWCKSSIILGLPCPLIPQDQPVYHSTNRFIVCCWIRVRNGEYGILLNMLADKSRTAESSSASFICSIKNIQSQDYNLLKQEPEKSSRTLQPPPGARNATRPQQVTWRHRSRDHSIRHVPFPIGAPLEPSLYLQPCSRLKFGLKFSVCAPITSGLGGYSHQTFPGHVMNFGPQTKKL